MSGKTIAEQIAGLKETRAALEKQMNDVAQKSMDEGRSMDTAEAEQFDTAESQIEALDADIKRLTKLENIKAASAQPAAPQAKEHAEAKAKSYFDVQLKQKEELEPGIAMARYAICLAKAKFNPEMAFRLAERHYPLTESVVRTLKAQSEGADLAQMARIKASVAGGTTTDSTWAQPLTEAQNFGGDFINFLRPRTLIGQAQFRPVPFNVRIMSQTSGGTAGWVGQGKAKPVTKFDFADTTVPFTKVAAISVITQELARFSDPSAEMLVRDGLADAVIARLDADLFDPDLAGVSGVNPAGLLNGVSPTVPTVAIDLDDPDTVRGALSDLWANWDATYLGSRPVYYTTPAVARQLSICTDALGTKAFPNVTMQGGSIDGVTVRVSQYLANNGGSGGAPFILIDEAEIYHADDNTVTLDASDVASLEMDSAPSGDSGAPTAAQLVSMWQTNSIAFRAERFVWWGARRSGAAQWIDGFPVA